MDNQETTDRLFAKERGARGAHKVIFSDPENIATINSYYVVPEISDEHSFEFTTERTIEDDEWFYITLDAEQKQELIDPYLTVATSTSDINGISPVDYRNIEAIYKVSGSGKILFNKITNGYRIESKRYVVFDGSPYLNFNEHAIELKKEADAYFNGSDRLYFRKYSTIRPLFKGIEQFFREATDAEKQEFLGNAFFNVPDVSSISIGARAAKQIAAILDDDTINLADVEMQHKIHVYAQRYVENQLSFTDDGRLNINSTKQLNCALSVLSGKYYTSELTGEKMEAHASSKVAADTNN